MNLNIFKMILLSLICSNAQNIFSAETDRKTTEENRIEKSRFYQKMALYTSIGAIAIPVLLKIFQKASKIRELEDSIEDLKSSEASCKRALIRLEVSARRLQDALRYCR